MNSAGYYLALWAPKNNSADAADAADAADRRAWGLEVMVMKTYRMGRDRLGRFCRVPLTEFEMESMRLLCDWACELQRDETLEAEQEREHDNQFADWAAALEAKHTMDDLAAEQELQGGRA